MGREEFVRLLDELGVPYDDETDRIICKTINEVTKILTQNNKTSVEIEGKKTQE